ncbi:MAG: hypothetical protein GOV02_02295 [Candidatus Aenigmarchaeota archaeon]|nr:hypothetical protein [Candidatus Aenigmarchaeota archaeon]
MSGIKIEMKNELTATEKAAAARAIVYSVMTGDNRLIAYPNETFTVTEVSHDTKGNVVEKEELYYSALKLERNQSEDDVFYIEKFGVQ